MPNHRALPARVLAEEEADREGRQFSLFHVIVCLGRFERDIRWAEDSSLREGLGTVHFFQEELYFFQKVDDSRELYTLFEIIIIYSSVGDLFFIFVYTDDGYSEGIIKHLILNDTHNYNTLHFDSLIIFPLGHIFGHFSTLLDISPKKVRTSFFEVLFCIQFIALSINSSSSRTLLKLSSVLPSCHKTEPCQLAFWRKRSRTENVASSPPFTSSYSIDELIGVV